MKRKPMSSTAYDAVKCLVPALAIAVLVFLLLLTGCTTKPAEPVTTPPPVTIVHTTVTTMTVAPTPTTESPDAVADRAFATAADACYTQTPVIANLSDRLTFATCMKNIPLPPGNCAQNYRYYVLKATNEDTSSAGYKRETEINNLAREAFLRGEGYDGIRQEYAPCGDATKIQTSFYK